MKKLTKTQKKVETLKGLKEALSIVNIGYPYYGVPEMIRKAIKFLKEN